MRALVAAIKNGNPGTRLQLLESVQLKGLEKGYPMPLSGDQRLLAALAIES